ncbi:MAG: hydantoinase/oxoprolinase family protein [Desulfobacterales bacterium]|nr:hydantoinase/oxoprolinase family protein [Desulfobacterales bacterium]
MTISAKTDKREYCFGIDIGGTFTDGVLIDERGRVYLFKTPTVPDNPTEGFMQCLRKAAGVLKISLEDMLRHTKKLSYGNTIATNALLEGRLAKTGLITTRGFKDVLIIARIGREYLGIDLQCERPPSLVPRSMIEEITERVDSQGEVVTALHTGEIKEVIRTFDLKGVEALAVCLLWSFKNPAHEIKIGKEIKKKLPGTYISLSHEIAPVIGEYERTATTVMNASLGPLIEGHLNSLSEKLAMEGLAVPLLLMQSTGGVVPAADAALKPVTLVNSGPAGGVIAGKYLSELLGMPNCLCVDMGGTSFDASLITGGQYSASLVNRVGNNNIAIPMLDIHSIGAGGGSIAWLDGGKMLKVGPVSAGAYPGPACYHRGGKEPTVTDVDVVLGRINPDYFLGGELTLDKEKAVRAIKEKIAKPLGMDLLAAAEGICHIVDANIADAVRTITLRKGYDPRDYSMLAFGGAGPVHTAAIAQELGIENIVIAPQAAVQSAFGIVQSDIVHSLTMGDVIEINNIAGISQRFAELEQKGFELLKKEGLDRENIEIRRWVDMHYRGQAHEVTVPVSRIPSTPQDILDLIKTFEQKYESIYGRGTVFSQAGYEIVTFRVDAVGKTRKPVIRPAKPAVSKPSKALKGKREVFFQGKFAATSIYQGDKLAPGHRINGPAIIEYMGTTVVMHPGMEAEIGPYLNIMMKWK